MMMYSDITPGMGEPTRSETPPAIYGSPVANLNTTFKAAAPPAVHSSHGPRGQSSFRRPPPIVAVHDPNAAGSTAGHTNGSTLVERNFASFRGMPATSLGPIEILSKFARKCRTDGSDVEVKRAIAHVASASRATNGRHSAVQTAKVQFARTMMASLRKDVVAANYMPVTPGAPYTPASTTAIHGGGNTILDHAGWEHHATAAPGGGAGGLGTSREGCDERTTPHASAAEVHLETLLQILFDAASTAARIQFAKVPSSNFDEAGTAESNAGSVLETMVSPNGLEPQASPRTAMPAGTVVARDPHREIQLARTSSLRMMPASPARAHADPTSLPDDDHTSATSIASVIQRLPAYTTNHADVGAEGDDGTFDVNQYILLSQIGHGRQGVVWLASDTTNGEMRAVKITRRPQGSRLEASSAAGGALAAAKARQWEQLEREVNVMKKCRHQNLVALHEVIDDPEQDRMYLVMQYVERGPLVKQFPNGTTDRVVEPRKMVWYARQLCTALNYLHQRGIVHRDIKPDNILLGQNDQVYLADFGMSELFEAHARDALGHSTNARVNGTRGTVAYLAPELCSADVDESGVSGEAVDVWALGMTFYVFLFGRLPWSDFENTRELFDRICNEPIVIEFGMPNPFIVPDSALHEAGPSPFATREPTDQSLVDLNTSSSMMLTEASPNPTSSLSTNPPSTQIPKTLHVVWTELLMGMLERDPQKRLTTQQCRHKVKELWQACGGSPHTSPHGDVGITSVKR